MCPSFFPVYLSKSFLLEHYQDRTGLRFRGLTVVLVVLCCQTCIFLYYYFKGAVHINMTATLVQRASFPQNSSFPSVADLGQLRHRLEFKPLCARLILPGLIEPTKRARRQALHFLRVFHRSQYTPTSSVKHRKVFESETITHLPKVWSSHMVDEQTAYYSNTGLILKLVKSLSVNWHFQNWHTASAFRFHVFLWEVCDGAWSWFMEAAMFAYGAFGTVYPNVPFTQCACISAASGLVNCNTFRNHCGLRASVGKSIPSPLVCILHPDVGRQVETCWTVLFCL